MNKILVIGSGGREHAIIHKLRQSNLVSQIFFSGTNAGIEEISDLASEVKIDDHASVINFCKKNAIDLVVIGPEQPLVAGMVDALQDAGISVFGPSKLAARLEGSKIFTKEICYRYNIPTAKYKSFDDRQQAIEYLKTVSFPCVIKADGIAAGKGVVIADDLVSAQNTIIEILAGKFGSAGNQIIIEEFLQGPEVSFFAICDGKNALFFGTAGDHKKVGENETGPNTGGMGSYSPSPLVSDTLKGQIMQEIIHPTLRAMNDLGCPFKGFLFAGLILTKNGPKLLEFNVRLGDPEAQSILPRLKSDLFLLMRSSIRGDLDQLSVEFVEDRKAVCVVVAARGYPEQYSKEVEIKNLELAANCDSDVVIFQAGTKKINSKIISNGGRVLGITAWADNFLEARNKAYQVISLIDYPDGFWRNDIASRVL